MIIAHTPSGKEINLQIIGGKLLAEIAAAGITGSISGAYKLTRPKIGCTHYAECAGKQIGLDAANYQIIRGMLDEINAAARKAEQDRLSLHVPGMDVLCAAHNAEEYYQRGFERMMEDGDNDGVRPPRRREYDAVDRQSAASRGGGQGRVAAAGQQARLGHTRPLLPSDVSRHAMGSSPGLRSRPSFWGLS